MVAIIWVLVCVLFLLPAAYVGLYQAFTGGPADGTGPPLTVGERYCSAGLAGVCLALVFGWLFGTVFFAILGVMVAVALACALVMGIVRAPAWCCRVFENERDNPMLWVVAAVAVVMWSMVLVRGVS